MEKVSLLYEKSSLFNSPYEIGSRALLILATINYPLSLEALIFLDYILVHSGDFHNGPVSLHANIPYREGELVVKRKVLNQSLSLFISKGLIHKKFYKNGIYFEKNELTELFISNFKSSYFKKLEDVVEWIRLNVPCENEKNIKKYFKKFVAVWDGHLLEIE